MRPGVRGAVVAPALSAVLVPAASTAPAAAGNGAGPLPLERFFDNTAVSDDARPGEADFDGSGASLSTQDLAAAGWTPGRVLTVQGARLRWPRRTAPPGRTPRS
ncbi:hypothetical protein SUDANB58_04880 [Streptomyces sp. enrichment culture]|uniref:hypothetical protein n=1 Tax=Streptomyces sp. enrichment culture TaxID=1795815 RepID=UPI003F5701A7